jgi:hypothetical protein
MSQLPETSDGQMAGEVPLPTKMTVAPYIHLIYPTETVLWCWFQSHSATSLFPVCLPVQDQMYLMKLLAAQLTGAPSSNAQQQQQQQQQQQLPGWQLATLQLPLLQQVVFATQKSSKTWAAAVLKHVRAQQQQQAGAVVAVVNNSNSSSGVEGGPFLVQQGPVAPLQAVQQLLQHWWHPPQQQQQQQQEMVLDPVTWLEGFATALQQQKNQQQPTAAVAAGSNGGPLASAAALAAWCDPQGVDPAVQLLLAALLQHPDAAIVSAAATVLQLLLLRVPQLAPAFLPLVLQQLRRSYAAAAAAAAAEGPASVNAPASAERQVRQLLQLLPAMCKDTSCAALVWRVLHPLMSAAQQQQQQQQQLPYLKQQQQQLGEHGGLLRAVAVQVSVAAWQLTGRGWGRAEAAVNGCIGMAGVLAQDRAAAMGREPLELRLLRATAVRWGVGVC